MNQNWRLCHKNMPKTYSAHAFHREYFAIITTVNLHATENFVHSAMKHQHYF